MPKNKNLSSKEYERLGKMLVEINDHGLRLGKGYYRVAFLRGLIGGFGGVIGATVLVGLLLWLLSLFDSVWFLSDFVETIQNTINRSGRI